MITAVLDANALVSGVAGFGIETSTPGALLHAWQNRLFTLIVSEPLLVEVARTLRKPYFASHVTQQRSSRFLALFRYRSLITPLSVLVQSVATHPEDDLVLSAAVSAQADYLVTGDKKLQDLGTYERVTIVSPRLFLDILIDE